MFKKISKKVNFIKFLRKFYKRKKIVILAALVFLCLGLFFQNNLRRIAADYFFSRGNYYFSQKRYNLDYAQRLYKAALRINPETHDAHFQLARIYFLQGQFDLARDTIGKEIEKQPEFKTSFYLRGLINGYDGKFQEAADDFEEFLKWKPSSWAAHNDLAWVYFQVGDFNKVLSLADDGLKYDPENPWLLNTKGLALYNLNQEEEAEKYLTKALEEAKKLSPDDWKRAYPGNDPRFSAEGLRQMLKAIEVNKNLVI